MISLHHNFLVAGSANLMKERKSRQTRWQHYAMMIDSLEAVSQMTWPT